MTSHQTAHDGRMHHHASGSFIETFAVGERGPQYVKGAERLPVESFEWLPLAHGRYMDVPVAGSKGTYLVLPFEVPFDMLVKAVATAKPRIGPFSVTKEQVEKAIAELQALAAALDG